MPNVKVVSDSWGWSLKWIGENKPRYIIGDTFGWYKHKEDAENAARVYNN